MTLIVHHMERSQSERVVFLCEELGIPYELKTYPRHRETGLAPEIFKKLHPAGTAPVMEDDTPNGKVVLAESGAIVEYINAVYGGGKFAVQPTEKNYPVYLAWLHFCQATLQSQLGRLMVINFIPGAKESQFAALAERKIRNALTQYDLQFSKTKYLAGDDLTLADIMTVFSLTTMRGFAPMEYTDFPNILRYLKDIGYRSGYQSAMAKGDPQITPMLGATVPRFAFPGLKK